MKNKLWVILLLFLTSTGYSFGQVTAQYNLYMKAELQGQNIRESCTNYFNITINSTPSVSWYENLKNKEEKERIYINPARNYYNISALSRYTVTINTKREYKKNVFGGCECDEGCGTFTRYLTMDAPYKIVSYKIPAWDNGNAPGVTMYVWPKEIAVTALKPNYDSNSQSLSFPADDRITLSATPGFHYSTYQWEYMLDGDGETWKSLPYQYQNSSSINISGADIFGGSSQAMAMVQAHNNISFRIKPIEISLGIGLLFGRKESTVINTVTLDLVPSAPHITGIDLVNNLCYGGSNGSATIYFDRDLLPGEKIDGQKDNIGGTGIASAFNQVDRSITFNNLQAGTYSFGIMGFYNKRGIANQGHTTYSDAPNHKINGTITSPSKITLTLEDHNNITCYNGYDGTITVKAEGGTGNLKLHWYKQGQPQLIDSVPVTRNQAKVIGELTAGYYNLFVTDDNNCKSETLTLPELTQPSTGITISKDVASCEAITGYGRSDGVLSIVVDGTTSGGTCTWYFNGSASLPYGAIESTNGYGSRIESTISDIPSGNYTVFFDDGSCPQKATFYVSEPPLLTVSISQSAVSCKDGDNGGLSASASGGVPDNFGYQYEWFKDGSPINQYTQSINNLSAGNYSVKVTDNNSGKPNTSNAYSTLANPTDVTLAGSDIVVTDVRCFGESNGSVRITPHGGAGRYIVSYNGPLSGTTPAAAALTISNLKQGDYHFTLQDVNGCSASPVNDFTFTVNQPAAPIEIKNGRVRGTSGNGRSDGSMSFQVVGGTPNIINGEPFYTTVWTKRDGGAANYEKLDSVIEGVFTTKLSKLPEGIYRLKITDQMGCVYYSPFDTIKEPPPLMTYLENTGTITCHGELTGELVAQAAGGVPFAELDSLPYNYYWYQVVNGVDSLLEDCRKDTLTHLSPGEYKVIIEDSADPVNRVESASFFIEEPPLLATEMTTRNIACFGTNDGFIHIHVSGGTPYYRLFAKGHSQDPDFVEYFINDTDSTFYLDNLISDVYSIYIIDRYGCYAKIEGEEVHDIYLSQPAAPLGIDPIARYDISGYGLRNGNIKFAVTGGTPNDDHSYKVEWLDEYGFPSVRSVDSLENNLYITSVRDLSVGEYTVKITDKNFSAASPGKDSTCFFTKTFTITEPDELIAAIEETHFVSCHGMSDGRLAVHVTGGVPDTIDYKPIYKYLWYKEIEGVYTGMDNKKDSLLDNIPAGNYRVIVEDYSWLPNRDTVDYTLVQPDILVAAATNIEIICGQVTDVSVAASGGTPPYHYEWSTGDTIPVLPDMVAGKYMVLVTDSRGCQTTAIAQVTTPSDLAIFGTLRNPLCYQGSNGSIDLRITGGTAPYSYRWSTGATTKTLSGVRSGTYSVIVYDRDGCSLYQSFTLTDPAPVSVYIGEDRILCKGQKLVLAPPVDDPKSKFSWSGPGGFSSTEPSVTLEKEGTYRLTITDSNGCQASDEINITALDLDISSEIVVSTQVFTGDTVVIVNISDPVPESMEWLIAESDSLKIIEKSDHSAQVVFKYPGYYPIGLRTFAADCYEDNIKSVSATAADARGAGFFGESIIKKFLVRPNPNNGVFTLDVELTTVSAIRLRIVDIGTGIVVNDTRYNGKDAYSIPYNVRLASAVYAVLLETASGYMTIKMIIK